MGVILKNNANSTITTAISASDVGLAVATGTGSIFPVLGAGDYFYATLVSSGGTYEIVKVTARIGDTMTIVRAQEDTTAQSFAAGSSFEARVTAASIRDTATDVVLTRLGSTAAGDGASLVGVQDVGNYYAATTVEGVLQELGASGGTVGINAIVDNFTGNGSTVNFTLSKAPVSQNTIDVFINGVYQNKTDFSFAGTTLTFTQAPPLGSEIEVCINTNALAGTVMASNVSYNQGGTGAVNRTVQTRLRDYVSVKDFGAIGDGVADDTAAVQAALNSQQPLDWGGLTYRITAAVSRTYTGDIYWEGRNATILYAGTHVERAVLLQGGGIDIVISDLTIDGGKLCNKCIDVLNDSDSYSNLTMTNVFATRAKRLNTFSGGGGMWLRGSFDTITINGGGASDCELPSGQGTSGSVGITGIAASFYSATRYVKSMRVNGVQIEKVYSSDLTYQDDQDGLLYFTPDDAGGTYKVPGELVVSGGSSFLNCYGRSIKTQCRSTIVQNSHFERTEGLTSGVGNNEIDGQVGSLSVSDCVFVYDNAQEPGVCVNCSSDATYGRPGLTVQNCEVYLDSTVTLSIFASTFPRSGLYSRHQVTGIKVFGKLKKLFDFICRGDKNYAEVSNCFANEIVNGETSQKALIYVRAGGTALLPYSAVVTAFGNVYDNTDLPAIMRDGVPGTSMTGILSAWNNQGFANDATVNSASAGLKTNQVARLGRFTSGTAGSYIEVLTKAIASGATETFTVANSAGCLMFVQAQFSSTAYALFSSTATTNTSISVGSSFALGNTSNPGTAVFNVWSSATNQISIQNTNASTRVVTVFVLAP